MHGNVVDWLWFVVVDAHPSTAYRRSSRGCERSAVRCCFSCIVHFIPSCHLTLALPPVSPPLPPHQRKHAQDDLPPLPRKPVCTPREARPTLELAWHATQNIASVTSPDELARPSTETTPPPAAAIETRHTRSKRSRRSLAPHH